MDRKQLIRLAESVQTSPVSGVDLFCGGGGLTHGLMRAGIRVEAGIDIDEQAAYAYVANNPGAQFLLEDVTRLDPAIVADLFAKGMPRVLAGCAPCQPFSKLYTAKERHPSWALLDSLSRLIREVRPEIVTIENVPELLDRGRAVFDRLLRTLRAVGYKIDYRIVNCAEYGVPETRRRLVLLASTLGEISIPAGRYRSPDRWRTVRQTIARLPSLMAGCADDQDPLHVAPCLSPVNLQRLRATSHDGGNRRDWPSHLVLDCHRKKSGERYHSIYGRMWWDKPAPTMTTLCTGIGNGRFGHPEQDRSITLREAALLQSFPKGYEFWPPDGKLNRRAIGRLIGNAVPPKLAQALGEAILDHVTSI